MSETGEGNEERLRPAPVDRFAGDSHVFDLGESLSALRAEENEPRLGHRQMTLFHRSPVAHVLFAFEPDGHLKEHSTNGSVTIHVLEGRLLVNADGHAHELGPGRVLILNPQVAHDVRALEASAMLLTVHLEEGAGSKG
jgi:quercetin dioxygenase-like cupin family protein